MAEFNLSKHKSAAPCSIFTSSDAFESGRIFAAKLGEGAFTTTSANILAPLENRRFMAIAIGGEFPAGGFTPNYPEPLTLSSNELTKIDDSIREKLGTASLTAGVDICFDDDIFKVSKSIHIPEQQQPDTREMEVLGYFACGLTCDQIAEELQIAPERVNTHRDRLFAKLSVRSIYALTTASRLTMLR
jgi:hypothetical protein